MALKTVQEVLNDIYNFSSYEATSVTSGDPTTWDKQDVTANVWTIGDLTLSASKPAREVHIHSPVDFSVYINGNADAKEIPLQAADSPFVINNMDVTSLFITATITVGLKLKIQAYYR